MDTKVKLIPRVQDFYTVVPREFEDVGTGKTLLNYQVTTVNNIQFLLAYELRCWFGNEPSLIRILQNFWQNSCKAISRLFLFKCATGFQNLQKSHRMTQISSFNPLFHWWVSLTSWSGAIIWSVSYRENRWEFWDFGLRIWKYYHVLMENVLQWL